MAYTRFGNGGGDSIASKPSATTGITRLLSCFMQGTGPSTAIVKYVIFWIDNSAAYTDTMEKTNTRSPAVSNGYSITPDTTGKKVLLYMGTRHFAQAAYRPNPRYPIMRPYAIFVLNPEVLGWSYDSGTSTNVATGAMFEETGHTPAARKFNRRIANRGGAFYTYGNTVHHHQQTGGGAYSMRAPKFFNDIAWQDSFAWRDGQDSFRGQDILLGAGSAPTEEPRLMTLMGVGP